MAGTPIVLIAGKDVSGEGGHQSYVRAHALAVQRAGYEPHVFCSAPRTRTERAAFGVIHRVRTPPHRTTPALLSVPSAGSLPFLARAVTAFLSGSARVGVIHSFGLWSAAGVLASRQLARRGVTAVPVSNAYATMSYEARGATIGVRDYHGLGNRLRYRLRDLWVHGVDNRIERWGYQGSRLVLINYESVRAILTDAYGDGLNLQRIPYCAPDAFDAAAPAARVPECVRGLTPNDAPLIVSTSRHAARKGNDVLLRALGRLKDDGVAFRACLVGPGTLLEDHRRLSAQLGLGGRTILPGAVTEVESFLAAADVFVLPSLVESSGSVSVLEALRAGLPVVSSSCDGLPEDLTHETDALLVSPGDVDALTAALRRMLNDPQLRGRLATNALATYKRRFSAQPLTAALGEIYASLGAGEDAGRAARIVSAT